MPKYRKKIWAGDVYEVEEFYCPRTIGKKYERGRNENLTKEEQEKRNLQRTQREMTRLINTNFSGKDYMIVLTYDRIVTLEEARREASNFFARLKRYRRSNGFSELKYIQVIQVQGRVHHHVVINGFQGLSKKITKEILQGIWDRGLVLIKHLYQNQKDNRLSSYLTRENYKKNGKRWSSSRNLKKPKVKIEVVKETKNRRPLRAPKNHRIVASYADFFEEIGWVRYMKAVKVGGMDYGAYEEGKPHMEHTDRKG